jgi:hypothetical protein
MTLTDFYDTFLNSTSNDWTKISCWGCNGGPSYKNQFNFWEVFDAEPNILKHNEHSNVASLKTNLSISIAWGLRLGLEKDVIISQLSRNNPDPSPGKAYFLDFFYNNSLVFRTSYCTVDGGRCELPFPSYDLNQNLIVPRKYHDTIKKFVEIIGVEDFDYYFGQSGMSIVDEN